MNYFIKFIFLPVIILITLFHSLSFADTSNQYENKALQFLEALKTEQPEKLYSFFSDETKNETKLEQLQPIADKLRAILTNAEDVKLISSEANVSGNNTYGLIYRFTSKRIPFEYKVQLVETKKGIAIRGFDITALVPDKLFSFKYASSLHYIVFSAFIACIVIQISCLVFFLFQRGLKRKWLYVCSAFIGAPAGVGLNWITGAITLSFGFKIPAVGVFWPAANPNIPTVFVYFPLGIIFLIRIIALKKQEQNVNADNSHSLPSENVENEIH